MRWALRGLAVLLLAALVAAPVVRADAPRWSGLSTLLMWNKAGTTGPTEVTAADPLPVTISGDATLDTLTIATKINSPAAGLQIAEPSGEYIALDLSTTNSEWQLGQIASTTRGLMFMVANTRVAGFNTDGNFVWPTDNGYSIGVSGATRPKAIFLAQPAITAGSGTGVTVNDSGSVRNLIYKVTVLSTNCIAAALTCDLTVATLPAKTFVKRVFADLTTTYACTATCTTATLSGTLGTTAGGVELLATMDLDAATAQFGDADAELGTSMNAAARTANGATIPGVLASWSGTTTVTYRITSAVGNLGNGTATNLSQGTIVFYIETVVMP